MNVDTPLEEHVAQVIRERKRKKSWTDRMRQKALKELAESDPDGKGAEGSTPDRPRSGETAQSHSSTPS